MKRLMLFLLVFSLFLCLIPAAECAASYTLPEPLKTVPSNIDGLALPDPLPPYVMIKDFSVGEDGAIHLELGDAVPRLKIMEQDFMKGVDSTIFTKKNASVADAHMTGKENSVFSVRMIWTFGNMEYVRVYADWGGTLGFNSCTATEELDPAPFTPYTSAVRTLTFNESGDPLSETWTLENDQDRFIRTAAYDGNGKLRYMNQTWQSINPGIYEYSLQTDRNGSLTALTVQDKKTRISAKSLRLDEAPNGAMQLSMESLDPAAFDEQLDKKYPQVNRGLIDYEAAEEEIYLELLAMFNMSYEDLMIPQAESVPSTMTDLEPSTMTDLGTSTMTDLPAVPDEDLVPIPANARLWSLNFGDMLHSDVYVFVTTDPLLILKDGKAVLNPDARDVNGDAMKLKRSKMTSPVMEIATAE